MGGVYTEGQEAHVSLGIGLEQYLNLFVPLVVQFWIKNFQGWCTCLERGERRGKKVSLIV